jgi:hypothetical protein
MDLVVNIAPVAGALLVCAIAWISVRRAYRKASAPPPAPRAASPSAAE